MEEGEKQPSEQPSDDGRIEGQPLFSSADGLHHRIRNEKDGDASSSPPPPPSNERLLGTAFVSFMTFALTQLLFAFVAGSEAMMGDSAAMIVDAITYLFNWIAERRKNRYNEQQQQQQQQQVVHLESTREEKDRGDRRRKRTLRKMVLQLEIIPPVISVTSLVIVTAFVTKKAIEVLVLDMHRPVSQQRRPNTNLMLAFSVFNLALDGLNMFCFAKAKHLLGFSTSEEDGESQHGDVVNGQKRTERGAEGKKYRQVNLNVDVGEELGDTLDERFAIEEEEEEDDRDDRKLMAGIRDDQGTIWFDMESGGEEEDDNFVLYGEGQPIEAGGSCDDDHDDHHHHHANLNMCSAYTHVFADTVRSVAVIVAAVVADVVPDVTPEEADAAAAVVVSVLILLSLIPLAQGLARSVSELRAILAEERSESMFAPNANEGVVKSESRELS
jgi:Co/Zn/Cd efflux system component